MSNPTSIDEREATADDSVHASKRQLRLSATRTVCSDVTRSTTRLARRAAAPTEPTMCSHHGPRPPILISPLNYHPERLACYEGILKAHTVLNIVQLLVFNCLAGLDVDLHRNLSPCSREFSKYFARVQVLHPVAILCFSISPPWGCYRLPSRSPHSFSSRSFTQHSLKIRRHSMSSPTPPTYTLFQVRQLARTVWRHPSTVHKLFLSAPQID